MNFKTIVRFEIKGETIMNSTVNISKKTVANHLKRIERRAEKRIERRAEKRIEHSLLIRTFDCEVKTKNISPEGVYFEVTTKDIKNYSPGRVIMIQIEAIYSKPELPVIRVCIAGFGEIVRVDEIDTINHYKKLGVALAFSEKLEVYF
ncbi:hypothetical protein LCGC14_3140530 [marine sediment metagenome]|uniref:PilZ domain-containing protein n=1 Tax=marine sediment metagenome TaxID=412755 RepID=A0A0F8WL09_9ZZZZ